jgi:tetratricopeptide (TPR) repeat protein
MRLACLLYQTATLLDHSFSEAYFNWGLALYNLKQYRESDTKYQRAAELDPGNPIVFNNWADVYYRLEEFSHAIELYKTALDLNPKYLKPYYNRGLAYACMQDYDRAISDFSKVLELDPAFPEAYHIRGLAHDYLSSVLEKTDKGEATSALRTACDDYRKAISLKSDFAECRYQLVSALNRLVGSSEDPAALISEINVLYGQLTSETLPEDMQIGPGDVWNEWGNFLFDLSRTREQYLQAAEKYQRAAVLLPYKAYVWSNWGIALKSGAELSNGTESYRIFREAGAKYKRAIELEPDSGHALSMYAYVMSRLSNDPAVTSEIRKEYAADAISYGRKACSLEKENPDFASSLAVAHVNTLNLSDSPVQSLQDAIGLYEDCVLTQKQVPRWQRTNYGEVILRLASLSRQKDASTLVLKALDILRKALDEDDKDPDTYQYLAEAEELIADRQTGRASVSHYEESAELYLKCASLALVQSRADDAKGQSCLCRFLAGGDKSCLAEAKTCFEKTGGAGNPHNLYTFAKISALSGDASAAADLLSQAIRGRWVLREVIERDPAFQGIDI